MSHDALAAQHSSLAPRPLHAGALPLAAQAQPPVSQGPPTWVSQDVCIPLRHALVREGPVALSAACVMVVHKADRARWPPAQQPWRLSWGASAAKTLRGAGKKYPNMAWVRCGEWGTCSWAECTHQPTSSQTKLKCPSPQLACYLCLPPSFPTPHKIQHPADMRAQPPPPAAPCRAPAPSFSRQYSVFFTASCRMPLVGKSNALQLRAATS